MRQMLGALGAAVLGGAIAMAAQPVASHDLAGGGTVSMRRDGQTLHVTVTGPRAGLASLCLADDSRVRILHASAAVGEAVYQRSGDAWTLASGFEFKLRETRTGPPPEADRSAFLNATGWLANATNAGTAPREFTIRLNGQDRYLGVTFFTTSDPGVVTYWPATIDDDCRAVKVAQGFLPKSAAFQPSRWYRIP